MGQKYEPIMTPTFRVAFPNVFTPKSMGEGQKEKFSIAMLFNPADMDGPQKEKWQHMKACVKNAAKDKFGDKMPKGMRNPFRDAAEKDEYDGYEEGIIFINATSIFQPGIVDQSREDIIDGKAFYGGCYARAKVSYYAYDVKGNKGVAFGIQSLQKVADGDSFGASRNAADDFDAIEMVEGAEVVGADNADSMFD